MSALQKKGVDSHHYDTPVVKCTSIYLYVRYKNGPPNPIQLECKRGGVAYNLAEEIVLNLKVFNIKLLSENNIGSGDITLYSVDAKGQMLEVIHPRTPLGDIEELNLEFDIDLRRVQIIHSDSTRSFLCRKDDTIFDLASKIAEKLEDFNFPDDYLQKVRNQLEKNGHLRIYQYPLASGRRVPLDPTEKVADFDQEKFIFSVESFQKYITLKDVQEEICGQNIVFFGVPDHGKSSTINSFITAITDEKGPAPTYPTSSIGTAVYTPYPVNVNEATFWLSDVPGSCKVTGTVTSQDSEEIMKKAIRRILEGKLPEGTDPIKYKPKVPMLSKGFVKPSAVVIINKWDADIDKFDYNVLTEASSKKMGLRTFLIVTHFDEAPDDPVEVNKILKRKSETLGIDFSNVYTITNVNQEAAHIHGMDDDRKKNALFILKEILYAAKTYMNNRGSSISQ